MTKVPDEELNSRVKDQQWRDIVKNYFGSEEIAVQGAEAMERRMEEIVKRLEKKISDGFANVATKSDVENIRDWIDIVAQAQGQNPGKAEGS
ncbi:MAG: hypothetical protein OXI53_04150 [Nitrospira sp.]|nr:hypothetical protein [Nitrospira sp.]